MICVTYYIERILIFSCVSLQVILGSPERIEPILEEPGSTVVHLTSSEKHLLYTDSRGQVTTTSIDTLKAFVNTGEICDTASGYKKKSSGFFKLLTYLVILGRCLPMIQLGSLRKSQVPIVVPYWPLAVTHGHLRFGGSHPICSVVSLDNF
jgi:hypothetical protein